MCWLITAIIDGVQSLPGLKVIELQLIAKLVTEPDYSD